MYGLQKSHQDIFGLTKSAKNRQHFTLTLRKWWLAMIRPFIPKTKNDPAYDGLGGRLNCCRPGGHPVNCAWSRSSDSMATNTAEVLELAARPTPYDNDERTWLGFRFNLENFLTLVNKSCVLLLQDAESQPVANVPAGTDEASVLIRTLSHTLYALLATLTTRRSLRLAQRVPNRNGFEAWRQLVAENAPKTAGRRFAKLCCSR